MSTQDQPTQEPVVPVVAPVAAPASEPVVAPTPSAQEVADEKRKKYVEKLKARATRLEGLAAKPVVMASADAKSEAKADEKVGAKSFVGEDNFDGVVIDCIEFRYPSNYSEEKHDSDDYRVILKGSGLDRNLCDERVGVKHHGTEMRVRNPANLDLDFSSSTYLHGFTLYVEYCGETLEIYYSIGCDDLSIGSDYYCHSTCTYEEDGVVTIRLHDLSLCI
jgi:hypothetical protein